MKKILLAFALIISTLAFTQEEEQGCLVVKEIPGVLNLNGDGMNDVWFVPFHCEPESFTISIYNRWGTEIFTSDEYKFQWTGEDSKHNAVPAGTYIWTLRFEDESGAKKHTGNLTVIR